MPFPFAARFRPRGLRIFHQCRLITQPREQQRNVNQENQGESGRHQLVKPFSPRDGGHDRCEAANQVKFPIEPVRQMPGSFVEEGLRRQCSPADSRWGRYPFGKPVRSCHPSICAGCRRSCTCPERKRRVLLSPVRNITGGDPAVPIECRVAHSFRRMGTDGSRPALRRCTSCH
jgi:hypothetical protein